MAKEALKQRTSQHQNGKCALTNVELPLASKLFDTDRKLPKAQDGTYTDENTRVVEPVAHMQRHENYRERNPLEDFIKSLIDERNYLLRSRLKLENQLLAYERNVDTLQMDSITFMKDQIKEITKVQAKKDRAISNMIKNFKDPLCSAALGVKGIGPITVAYCFVYIDLEKARHASSVWSYAGLHTPSWDRYKKGQTSGGNKKLRTILYTMAESQVKSKGAYAEIYYQTKERLANSNHLVWSYTTKGYDKDDSQHAWRLVEMPWKDTKPSHRHGAALRKVMKHFLADYWYVGRTTRGLPTSPLYPEAVLQGNHRTIMPEERGWKY